MSYSPELEFSSISLYLLSGYGISLGLLGVLAIFNVTTYKKTLTMYQSLRELFPSKSHETKE